MAIVTARDSASPPERVAHGEGHRVAAVVGEGVVRGLAGGRTAVAELPCVAQALGATEVGAAEIGIGARRGVEGDRRAFLLCAAERERRGGRPIARLERVLEPGLEQRENVVAGRLLDPVHRGEVLLPRIVPHAGDVGHVDGHHRQSRQIVPALDVAAPEWRAPVHRADQRHLPRAVRHGDLAFVPEEDERVRRRVDRTGDDVDGETRPSRVGERVLQLADTP